MITTVEELKELGFTAAAAGVERDRVLAHKMRVAWENTESVITPEIFAKFCEDLRRQTERKTGQTNQWGEHSTFDTIKLTSLADYPEVPPKEALDALKRVKDLGCFDSFEVATRKSVHVIPDPVIFGRINDCPDRYTVAIWGDDLPIREWLAKDEVEA